MTVTVVVIGTDATAEVLWLDRAELSSRLTDLVGGLYDVVSLGRAGDAWVNDEGLYLCEPNPAATIVAWRRQLVEDPERLSPPLFGPVVLTGGVDSRGDTVSLSTEEAEQVMVEVRQLAVSRRAMARLRGAAETYQLSFR